MNASEDNWPYRARAMKGMLHHYGKSLKEKISEAQMPLRQSHLGPSFAQKQIDGKLQLLRNLVDSGHTLCFGLESTSCLKVPKAYKKCLVAPLLHSQVIKPTNIARLQKWCRPCACNPWNSIWKTKLFGILSWSLSSTPMRNKMPSQCCI